MSNKTKTTESTNTQTNKLDPRMDALLYGDNGLMGMASELVKKPAINDRMRQGMDSQANYLQSPLYQAIFNQILGQGSSLMGRGVAGNPYASRGSMGFGGGMGMGGQSPFGGGYTPNYAPQQGQQAQQMSAPAMQAPPQQEQQSQLTPEQLRYIQLMSGQHYQSQNGG